MRIRGREVLPVSERIRSSSVVNATTGCWEWRRSVRSSESPYGRLMVGSRATGTRRTVSAHRASYEAFVGPIPAGLHVCLVCDNPRCVNPAHLFVGTAKENAADRDSKGRLVPAPVRRGSEGHNAKLSPEQVREIRASRESSAVVARRFGMDDSHIRAIRRGEHHKLPSPPDGAHEDC